MSKRKSDFTRRRFLQVGGIAGAGVYLSTRAGFLQRAYGATQVAAIPLPGSAIPQFINPLPDLVLVDGTDGSGGPGALTIRMQEFLADVMPSTFVPAAGTYQGTWVWGYQTDNHPTPLAANGAKNTYINPVILAKRGVPTQITWVNELGTGAGSNLYWEDWTDQTLHWADPEGQGYINGHYSSWVPAVPHLHGGEIPPKLDGGPDAWWTANGSQGHAYYSQGGGGTGYAIYRYPNSQEAANIWFHDHGLGITRLNVYAGLAGAYLISDSGLPTGLTAHGIGAETIIPLVLQDRTFDTNGQLYLHNVGINTEHPFWVPEFVGDTIVVNGKVWPFLNIQQAKRYRFLFLNGSNARTYELFLVNPVTKAMGPPLWVIGTDGGYLDAPAKIDPALGQKLVIMPGERYDVIIDFAGFANQTLILRNTGRTPYPKGAPPQGSTLGQVIQFRVGSGAGTDASYDPASGIPLRPEMIRLVDPVAGTAAGGVTTTLTRQLTLNEVMGPGGPLEVLVNNTKYDGRSVATELYPGGVRPDFTYDPSELSGKPICTGSDDPEDCVPESYDTTYYSELPDEGATELWEIVNLTADAHPIHLHLVQFQLMNRQNFNVNTYNAWYNAQFPATTTTKDPMTNQPYPGGVFIGGYGPPLKYDGTDQLSGGKLGGNPDIGSINKKGKPVYLQDGVTPPLPHEAGWKDTVVAYPGQVTRIMVRWAPTDVAVGDTLNAHFPFNPNHGHGYVWHCHIIDHEDNEMMRPTSVKDNQSITDRAYKQGIDY